MIRRAAVAALAAFAVLVGLASNADAAGRPQIHSSCHAGEVTFTTGNKGLLYVYRSYRLIASHHQHAVSVWSGGHHVSAWLKLHGHTRTHTWRICPRPAVHHAPAPKPVAEKVAVPVTSCTGLPTQTTGAHAWMNNRQGTAAPLFTNIGQLICSAADGATVQVKSWPISDDPGIARLVADLAVMHKYHHVAVQIVVGRNGYTSDADYAKFQAAFAPFADVTTCALQCGPAASSDSLTHSKFITVSQLRQGGAGVLSMSANLQDAQFLLVQSGIFLYNEPDAYSAFAAQFAAMRDGTADPQVGAWSYPAPLTALYFAPVTTSPIAGELQGAVRACAAGGTVDVVSNGIIELAATGHAAAVTTGLAALQAAGCTVRTIMDAVGDPIPGAQMRCGRVHDKSITIDTPTVREVIAGSDNFGDDGLVNDQQELRVRSGSLVAAYEAQFNAVATFAC